jgi:hypothetical protein
VAFARRLASDTDLRAALDRWFEERPELPEGVDSGDWLRWEQEKHERLLGEDRSGAGQPTPSRTAPDKTLENTPA